VERILVSKMRSLMRRSTVGFSASCCISRATSGQVVRSLLRRLRRGRQLRPRKVRPASGMMSGEPQEVGWSIGLAASSGSNGRSGSSTTGSIGAPPAEMKMSPRQMTGRAHVRSLVRLYWIIGCPSARDDRRESRSHIRGPNYGAPRPGDCSQPSRVVSRGIDEQGPRRVRTCP
jgi:hypothetical protein